MCKKHYGRWYRHGDPLYTRNMSRAGTCGIEDCGEPIKAQGMCSVHYQRMLSRGDTGLAGRERRPRQKRCEVPGCRKPHVALGWCESHYDSHRKYGDHLEVDRRKRLEWLPCVVKGCDRDSTTRGLHRRPGAAAGMCVLHARRLREYGSTDLPERVSRGYINAGGYRMMSVPGRGVVQEHRLVMERMIGRRLTPEENVHHKNGLRADNRPKNLELWANSQCPGQRVVDLVSWAQTVLDRYGSLVDQGAIT